MGSYPCEPIKVVNIKNPSKKWSFGVIKVKVTYAHLPVKGTMETIIQNHNSLSNPFTFLPRITYNIT